MESNSVCLAESGQKSRSGAEKNRYQRKTTRATLEYHKKRRPLTFEQHEQKRKQKAIYDITYPDNKKYCQDCSVLKPTVDFHIKRTGDGLSVYCADCDNRRARERYHKRKTDAEWLRARNAKPNPILAARSTFRAQQRAQLVARVRYGVAHMQQTNRMHLYEIAYVLGVAESTLRGWLKSDAKLTRETVITANDRLTAFLNAERDLAMHGVTPIPVLVCARADETSSYDLYHAYLRAQAFHDKKLLQLALRRRRETMKP